MLALLERCVTDLGGTYAMEDTDSMAIVATQRGGLIEFPGGPYRRNSKPAIRLLSWAQVDAIVQRFATLSPYDRSAIPGSILKIEDDNFDPETARQRQLWCLAISAKRYALFVRDPIGEPALLRKGINNKEDRYSEHGLGHLLNPTDPKSDDRSWIAQAWLAIVRRSLGAPTKPLGFEKRAAVGRITVSSPQVMKPLKALNAGSRTPGSSSRSTSSSAATWRTSGIRSASIPSASISSRLTRPIRGNGRSCSGSISIPASTTGSRPQGRHGSRIVARVKSYGDVLREYEFHPEAKCADITALHAQSKASGSSGGATSLSIRSRASARSPIASKRSKSKAFSFRATFTPSIPIRGATSGTASGCRCCDRRQFQNWKIAASPGPRSTQREPGAHFTKVRKRN